MSIKSLIFTVFALFALSASVYAKRAKKSQYQQSVPQTEMEVIIPCTGADYRSNSDFFRASAFAASSSQEIATQKAMTQARANLAALINTTVKSATDKFISSKEGGVTDEIYTHYASLTRESVNVTLRGIRVICQKTTQGADGKFQHYIAIELAADELCQNIARDLSESAKLRADFEYQKFLETFESVMSKTK